MVLNYAEYGDKSNPAIIILHGLLGSGRNWLTVARDLSQSNYVVALDARNHGQSFRASSNTFDDMVNDLGELMDHLGLDSVTLIGHSMGGKVAMIYACLYPERVDELLIVDIAPKQYPPHHDVTFKAMNELDLGSLEKRSDADPILAKKIESWAFRQFVISNIIRNDSGELEWLINLAVLTSHLRFLANNPMTPGDLFEGKARFLIGGKSNFVAEEDFGVIKHHFPEAEITVWEESGHNPHFDDRTRFVEWVGKEARSEK